MRYRLLALDLDETLLTKDKQISSECKKWIEQTKKSGVAVIMATGRGRQRVESIQRELVLDSPMVLVNGGEVWGMDDVLLERSLIPHDKIRILHQLAESFGASYWGYNLESLVGRKHWNEEMFSKDWLKFGMRHSDSETLLKIKEAVSTFSDLGITHSGPTNIEIGLRGKSKATGIKRVCRHLGIKMEEVMAIGDNLNDLSMIRAAGLGVAMGNANAQLKAAADVVTETNEREGVALAIQNYLFSTIKSVDEKKVT
ncbi:cof-like hydrolase [Oceanobacillus picturae]|uniref:Cof-like hydrolase n=1 Tax=Oceanobacillus picturae TaxID=171693 RepID=A0A0U9H2R6_9BACI|nr:Cof-type HAD-IIB family hydrolase [Oceanobacillus picturae]RIU94838.1 HAD family phosphatase [Oceanobacillus picturae]GAQ16949.1 cof-like hydrolase [Oceanobacillus picturae]